MDIMIYSKYKKVAHKLKENCDKDTEYCYWTTSIMPRHKVEHIYFSDGVQIFAKGRFLNAEYDIEEGKKILKFLPLEKCYIEQPKKPPTRGWCYINNKTKTD